MRKPEPCGLFPIVQKEQVQEQEAAKTTKMTVLEEVVSFFLTCLVYLLGVVLIPVIVVGWCLVVQYFFNMLTM